MSEAQDKAKGFALEMIRAAMKAAEDLPGLDMYLGCGISAVTNLGKYDEAGVPCVVRTDVWMPPGGIAIEAHCELKPDWGQTGEGWTSGTVELCRDLDYSKRWVFECHLAPTGMVARQVEPAVA